MDPCLYISLKIEALALKLPPSTTEPAGSAEVYYSSTTPCFCKLKIKNFPSQTILLPLDDSSSPGRSTPSSAGFLFDPTFLRRLSGNPVNLEVSVYSARTGGMCGFTTTGKVFLGGVTVIIDLNWAAEPGSSAVQNGWVKLGHDPSKPSAELHLVIRLTADSQYVFQFGGEPECSPVVFQIQEHIRQPVFTCKFINNRNLFSPSLPYNRDGWIRRTFFPAERARQGRERKGWMVVIHDLKGSPVAAASIITPFVPSPGSDHVTRSNPGAWLIYRRDGNSLKAWGHLEAWREKGPVDGLGYKFERVNSSGGRIPIVEAALSVKKGGQFCIHSTSQMVRDGRRSPARGFVMSTTVEGEGKVSKPVVQVRVRHVTCMADFAVFIALSAAIDLSMDACRLFRHKLRKELRPPS